VKEREGVATEAGRENRCSQVRFSEHCYRSRCTLVVCSGSPVPRPSYSTHLYWLSGMKLLGEALGTGIITLLPYLQMSSSLMFLGCSFLSPQLPSLYLYQQLLCHAPFSLFHLLYHIESSPLGYHLSRSCCGRQSRQSGLARTHGHWQGAARKCTLL